jgi:hypothetical protein
MCIYIIVAYIAIYTRITSIEAKTKKIKKKLYILKPIYYIEKCGGNEATTKTKRQSC